MLAIKADMGMVKKPFSFCVSENACNNSLLLLFFFFYTAHDNKGFSSIIVTYTLVRG